MLDLFRKFRGVRASVSVLVSGIIGLSFLSACGPAPGENLLGFPENPIESSVPVLKITRSGDELDFSALVPGFLDDSAIRVLSVDLDFVSQAGQKVQNGKLYELFSDSREFEIHRRAGPILEKDISGGMIQLDGALTELSFKIPADKFPDPDAMEHLVAGKIVLRMDTRSFERTFAKMPPADMKALEQGKIPVAQSSEHKPGFAPVLKLPVTVFDASPPEKEESIKDLLGGLLAGVSAVWTEKCGIQPVIRNYLSFDRAVFQNGAELSAEVSPELIYLQEKARKALGKKDAGIFVISNVAIQWPSRQKVKAAVAPIGYSFLISGAMFSLFRSESFSFFREGMVLLHSIFDSSALSHEIGHVLLGKEHEPDQSNVMFPIVGGTELRSDQCEKARAYVQGHFSAEID